MELAFNKLNPAQLERLYLLSEELGEAQQAVGKILRHGYDSFHPDAPGGSPDNRENLMVECGHVLHSIERLCNAGDLSQESIDIHKVIKATNVARYLHHQG